MLKKNNKFDDYFTEFIEAKHLACQNIKKSALNKFSQKMENAISSDNKIFLCGNGGSLSVANHMLCDIFKQLSTDTYLRPKVFSLATNFELMTAISNDISYNEIFSYQLNRIGTKNDLLITISSSGNSQNIINVIKLAKKIGIYTVALTGFKGGKSSKICDLNINVEAKNYGIIEDSHSSILHAISQHIRKENLKKSTNIKKIKF
tara:strand:- start:1873 stop:2487 length:615 start_codon:yes stop_codon:yes gene_type:complete